MKSVPFLYCLLASICLSYGAMNHPSFPSGDMSHALALHGVHLAGIDKSVASLQESRFRIHISDNDLAQDTTTMVFGNDSNATYCVDGALGEVIGPPIFPGFDVRWVNIPGRVNCYGPFGLLRYNFISPTNGTGRDTFELGFSNSGTPGARWVFRWSDSLFATQCDSMVLTDSAGQIPSVNMLVQDSLVINGPGSLGISKLIILKSVRAVVSVPESLVSFGGVLTGFCSARRSYVVSGKGLHGPITVTAPNGFKVSDDDTNFSTSILLNPPGPSGLQDATVYVEFCPTDTIAYSGQITHSSDSAATTYTSVNGKGIAAPVFVVLPTALSFGRVAVGAAKTDSVAVTNVGNRDLIVAGPASDDSSFLVESHHDTLSPSEIRNYAIAFRPLRMGADSGHVLFTHNAEGSPASVLVNGTGMTSIFVASPESVAFGNIAVSTNTQDTITISNSGNDTLVIFTSAIDNQAFKAAPASARILPGENQGLIVSFAPESLGYYRAHLMIQHNAPGSPSTIILNGTAAFVRLLVQNDPGWNMISSPVIPPSDSADQIYPAGSTAVYAYDVSSGRYDARFRVAKGIGYWDKFRIRGTTPITGVPVEVDSIPVLAGWNMIGSISVPVPVSGIGCDPPGMAAGNFFTYAGGYTTVDTIQSGRGYWVRVNEDGKLILARGSAASGWASAGPHIKIVSTSELPPPPPDEPSLPMKEIPKEYRLEPPFPNPFNPTTTIKYELPTDSRISLRIFNSLGQEVSVVVDEIESAGYKEVAWNANDIASGVYFCRFEATSLISPRTIFKQVKKILLLK